MICPVCLQILTGHLHLEMIHISQVEPKPSYMLVNMSLVLQTAGSSCGGAAKYLTMKDWALAQREWLECQWSHQEWGTSPFGAFKACNISPRLANSKLVQPQFLASKKSLSQPKARLWSTFIVSRVKVQHNYFSLLYWLTLVELLDESEQVSVSGENGCSGNGGLRAVGIKFAVFNGRFLAMGEWLIH